MPELDDYWFLVDVINAVQSPRVAKTFEDVVNDVSYPNMGNPRHVLAKACTQQADDTDTMVIMRLLLYYLLSHKAKDFHPTMFATPETNFHDSFVFKPQIQLVFYESRIDAFNADRRPLRTEISFRLMDVSPTSITTEQVNILGQAIWDNFVETQPFVYEKGSLIGSYRDRENGYELKVLGRNELTIITVLSRVLAIKGLEVDEQYLTFSESRRSFPTANDIVTVLGEDYSKPVQRPRATVHFVKAELKLLGMRASKLLVCRSDYLDARCERVF